MLESGGAQTSAAVRSFCKPFASNENGAVLNAAVLSYRRSRKALSALFTT